MPQILSAEERSLLLIEDEISYRSKVNPLQVHELMPMQAAFKADPAKTKCIFGGNRSGKSECVADCVVEAALSKPKQKIWSCGETFQDSIAIQQSKIWNLVPKNRIKYGKYDSINGFTNRKLLFDNGTLITFKSYDQGVEVFQSDDIDLIWNDEEPPFEVYKEQRMRLIDRNGQMIISMTSLKGITDLIENIYQDHDVIRSQHAPLVDEELPRIADKNGVRFYFLWSEQNQHIDQERLASESKLMTRQEIKSRYYGIPMNLSGKIYIKFNHNIHVVENIESMPEGRYSLYNIVDPHDAKPWAICWIAVHETGSAYCVDEYPEREFHSIEVNDKTYEEYAAIIKGKEAELKDIFGEPVRRRIIDPNFGNKPVQLAERQGNQSTTTPKKMLGKLGLLYRDGIDVLEAGHLQVRQWINWEEKDGQIIVQPRFKVLAKCHNMIRGMSRYQYTDPVRADGDVKEKVGPQEKWKHFPDLTRYFVMSNPGYIEETKEPEYKKAY